MLDAGSEVTAPLSMALLLLNHVPSPQAVKPPRNRPLHSAGLEPAATNHL